jgi:HlyD family secretion protein
VTRISADVSKDQGTAVTFYTDRVALPPEEVSHLGGLRLVADAGGGFVQTRERTPLRYFVKPLQDQIVRAFRES